MDGRLAVAFWLMSLVPNGYHGNDFSVSRSDAANRLTISEGVLQHAGKTHGMETRLTYAFEPIFNKYNPVIDMSLATGGATWIGLGLYQQFNIDINDQPFFAGFSFIPGLYLPENGYRMGNRLEFRSGVEFGYRLKNGAQISLAYDHRSNCNLGFINPGLESVSLRFSIPIQ